MSMKTIVAGLASSVLLATGMPLVALAASPTVVTPTNTQGWITDDTRPGGAVNFVNDSTAPAGVGALQLTTDATTAAKAQYMHAANTPLSNVNNLSYYTKQVSASFPGADASYQLPVLLDGTATSFTTLVYEPYENGTVVPSTWQKWTVDAGQFWSSRTVTSGTCAVVKGAGGPPFYTLAQLKTLCPNAVVVGYGVNIGTYNPGYNVETDLFNFNDVTYNFEPTVGPPTSTDQCKHDGWKTFNNPTFSSRKECERYVRAHAHGNLTLANPHQKIKFNVFNQQTTGSEDENDNDSRANTVEYWNYDYAGGVLHYSAAVTCTNVNPTTGEARFLFQIPEGHPGLSGLYVVAYVKDVADKHATDLYGHAATADLATATTWCQTGVGFAPTMYPVTDGSVKIN